MRPVTRFYEKSLLLEPGDFRARKWACATWTLAIGFLLGWLLT